MESGGGGRGELRGDEDLLRLATEFTGVAVWEYDFATNSMARSDNHDALYGLAWQEVWRLETFLAATHPEDRDLGARAIAEAVASGGPDEYEFDFRVLDPTEAVRWLWVRGRVVARDAQGRGVLVRGALIDVTERHRLERRLERLTRLYATLSECNQAVVHSASEAELYARICAAAVRVGSRAAWVAEVVPGGLRVVAHAGEGLQAFLGERAALVGSGGASDDLPSRAIATDRIAFRQIGVSAMDALGEAALRRGWRSGVALPLRRAGRPVATLAIYAAEGGFFDESVAALLEEIAGDVSFALDRFAAERRHGDLEARLAAVVDQEVVGVVAFDEGRLTFANERAAALLGFADSASLVAAPPEARAGLSPLASVRAVARGTLRVNRAGVPASVRYAATPVVHEGRAGVVGVLGEGATGEGDV